MESVEKASGMSPDSGQILRKIQEQSEELRPVDVPEWGSSGEPYTVYMKPLSLWQMREIRKVHGSGDAELNLFVVLRNAHDKDGNRLFDEKSRSTLRDAPAALMVRLSNVSFGGLDLDEPSAEEAEKN